MVSHCLKVEKGKIIQTKSLPGLYITRAYSGSDRRKGAPRCTWQKASFTIEAALLFPMVVCFLVSILFFFRVMQVELQVEKSLVAVAEKMAVNALAPSDTGSVILGMAGLQLAVRKELEGKDGVSQYVSGGAAGVFVSGSKLSGDFIDIHATWKLPLPIRLPGIRNIKLERRVCARKWTGFHGEGEQEENRFVYVTETGTVYHLTRECRHLRLSISSVASAKIAEQRNENGGKYSKCEKCTAGKTKPATVYITKQGDRYHYDLGCSGLKRTIFMVRLSEVGDRPACSSCGGIAAKDEEKNKYDSKNNIIGNTGNVCLSGLENTKAFRISAVSIRHYRVSLPSVHQTAYDE